MQNNGAKEDGWSYRKSYLTKKERKAEREVSAG
jgi:hypothetical protein